jgi:glyoxylase-like metal-dependent hydrolase (beta-lactamase superfamily II)
MKAGLRRALLGVLACAVVLAVLAVWRMPEVAAWQWYFKGGTPEMSTVKPELEAGLHWAGDYYVVGELGGHAYAIGEPLYGQCNFSYLIVGAERALLFDTGPGVRDIAPIVHALTPLPVIALPSHLHFDHTGDLVKFKDIALPDLPALRAQVHDGKFSFGLNQFLGFVEGFKRPTLEVTHWIAPDSEIDLGGRQLKMLSVPGHTPDSVVLLDTAENRLFAGDFIYPSSIYAFLPGANLRDYAASGTRLAALLNDRSKVYGAHGCDQLPRLGLPLLDKADVVALARATAAADASGAGSMGWYPRVFPINAKMKLLAKYPWMSP